MAFKKPTVHKIVPDIKNASIYLRGEPKTGKALPVSELVLTANGWIPMGEIKVGDQVYGEDGKLHEVKGVFPQGIQDVYKVTFLDGSSVRCTTEHLWSLRSYHTKDNTHPYRTLHLSDILDDYKAVRPQGKILYRYSVPPIQPIEFPKKDLTISPYLMGLLLGDGGFTDKVITFTKEDQEVLDSFENEIKAIGLEVTKRKTSDSTWQYTVKKESDEYRNKLKTLLDEYGLVGCGSREKFIPQDYLYSDVEDRKDLLRGLINTDGYIPVNKTNGTRIVFDSYSERLALDVVELARGLGYKVSIQYHDRTNDSSSKKYDKEIEHVVSIMGQDFSDLHLVKRHSDRIAPNPQTVRRAICNIELAGQEECQCIWVDNPSHLYITKDYIPTHNTTLFRDVILEKYHDPERGLLIKCGAESGDTMLDEVNSVQVETWAEVKELAEWLIEQKGKEHNIEIIAFDTVDELIKMAELKAMADSWKESQGTKNPVKPKSINQAFGGYGKGPAYVVNMLLTPLISKLKQHFGLWGIAHTKMKTSSNNVDSLNAEVAVQQLTSNLDSRYEACFGGLLDIIVTGAFENNDIIGSVEKGVGSSKKEVSLVDPTKQKRRFYFRSTAFVDAGSRFADYAEIPESMEYKLNHNNAKEFIDIVELGMEKSKLKYRQSNNNIPVKSSEEPVVKNIEKKVVEVEDPVFVEPEPAVEDANLYDQVVTKFKACKDRDLKAKVKEISGGSVTRNTPDDVLKSILELLG